MRLRCLRGLSNTKSRIMTSFGRAPDRSAGAYRVSCSCRKARVAFLGSPLPRSKLPSDYSMHLPFATEPRTTLAGMATPQAYHCLCTTLVLATNYDLESLPLRAEPALDRAKILLVDAEHAILHNIDEDRKPVMIRRQDGFEKRALLRCKRCSLVVGYKLDEAQFDGEGTKAEQLVYLLPGSLMSTEDMKEGKTLSAPAWAQQKT